MIRTHKWSFLGALALVALALVGLGGTVQATVPSESAAPVAAAAPFDCRQVAAWGLDRQLNMHAAALLIGCGQARGGTGSGVSRPGPARGAAPAYGGSDILVNNVGADTFPAVTQNESIIAAHGPDVVMSFFTSSYLTTTNNSGLAVSHDGGATYTDLRAPLTGRGANYGKVAVVYNPADSSWYASALAAGCGGQGIGVWKSNTGNAWSALPCAHTATQDDAPTLAVDANPDSPYYGRLTLAWNDFAANPNGTLFVTTSTNGGASWAAPIQVAPPGTSVVRAVRLVADVSGAVGTLYLFANDENGGGFNPRTHLLYRSTDGGSTWTPAPIAAAVSAPGDDLCSVDYFARITPLWRWMGAGQPAVGPGNVLHYIYGGHGAATDPADVLYIRSTDAGATWSVPLRLSTDPGSAAQWLPALAVTDDGVVTASWYDRRNSTDGLNYEYRARLSTDNGITWGADEAVSDVLIPQPAQPDPTLSSCFGGDYNYSLASGGTAFVGWTDGRLTAPNPQGTPVPQQDLRADRLIVAQGTATPTVTGTPPSATPTYTPVLTATPSRTATPSPTVCGGGQYLLVAATGTVVPGTVDVGNHCDDCATLINLPFAYTFYDQTYSQARVTSNGLLAFALADESANRCLPDPDSNDAIFAHWDDLDTRTTTGCATCGIFTATSGAAPNRVFNIEWHARYLGTTDELDFEIRLFEGQTTLDVIYGAVPNGGDSATIGVQRDTGSRFTQYSCDSGNLSDGLRLTFHLPTCPTGGTVTPSPTPATSDANYQIAPGTGPLTPAVTDIGNHCDDCTTNLALPFAVPFYGQFFSSATVSSNGRLGFTTMNGLGGNTCLPNLSVSDAIAPFWDDLDTRNTTGCATCGIFTATTGLYPNRVFTVEWRATQVSGGGLADFAVRFFEGSPNFDFVYGLVPDGGAGATIGVQRDTGSRFTQYRCNTGGLAAGTRLSFTLPGCVPPSPTPAATPTACVLEFLDVPPGNTFYTFVRCLACQGILAGYPCGGPGEPCPGNYFRPGNNVTRGQVSKIVANAAGYPEPVPSTQQTFEDVPPTSTFWVWIERIASRGYISGYPCGQNALEPCVGPLNRPYFRPNNNVTRGQLSKIVANAAQYTETPTGQTFEDVPPTNTFYLWITRLSSRGIINGYPCGGPNEPCVGPTNRPYFRPNNNVTRGQTAKIVANTFFPNCAPPADRR
jgi:hypothetical protein